MRRFFEKRAWDLEEVEYVFMARCVSTAASADAALSLPESLHQKAEPFLLARGQRLEQSGRATEALASAEVLLRLEDEHGIPIVLARMSERP